MVAPNGTTRLALRSRAAQGWVHSMTAGGHHRFPYHATAEHRGAFPMAIIHAQVHAYEANTPQRPWHSVPNWPDHVTSDEMVAAMDTVGVDGAIFISAFSLYQYDASYAMDVQRAHPGRFTLVKPVNPDDPAVADARSKAGGTCFWRLLSTGNAQRHPLSPFPPCPLPAYSFTTRSSAAERSIASISVWRVTARSKSTSNPVPAAKACAARL